MRSSKVALAGYFIESFRGVSTVDTYYEYELRNLDNPTRGSGWTMKSGGLTVKTDSRILSSVRSVVTYLRAIRTEDEKIFFAIAKHILILLLAIACI